MKRNINLHCIFSIKQFCNLKMSAFRIVSIHYQRNVTGLDHYKINKELEHFIKKLIILKIGKNFI